MEDLALNGLECHLNWRPESDPFTESHLRNIIKKTERKILRYPQFTVAYCCTLAYLHTLKGINDFNEAHKFLEEETILAERQNCRPKKRWLDCDFIVRANRLKLKEFENRNIMNSHTDELHELSILWADKRTKAAVYAIKAVTFSCFGPRGIPTAIDACKTALLLAQQNPSICTKWQKFDSLWCCAFNMSRQTRQTHSLETNDEELRSWQEAFSWKESNKLNITDPLFYAQYAEAIMFIKKKRDKCEDLMENAMRLWRKVDFNRKFLYGLVITIALRFGETYPELSFQVKKFVSQIDLDLYLGYECEMFRQVAKSLNYDNENEQAIEILEKAHNSVGFHMNCRMDLQLLGRKSKFKPEEWVRLEYTSLFQKYKCSSSGMATIYVHRAMWLFHEKNCRTLRQGIQWHDYKFLDECISDLVEAESKVNQWGLPLSFKKQLQSVLMRSKSERPEYFAWFKSSYYAEEIKEPGEIIQLYESVLGEDGCSIQRQIFCRKHLGIFLLQNQKLKQAVSVFRPLTASNEEIKKLFFQSILENLDHSLYELRECPEIRNCDVIETILSFLEAEKKMNNVRDTLMSDNFPDHGQVMRLFFDKVYYETCAMIHLVLESEESFFVTDGRKKTPDFVENVMDRVNKLLEIPVENPSTEKYAFRQSRLQMTKLKSEAEMFRGKSETLNTLRNAGVALNLCFAEFFNLPSSCFFPHAINTMQEQEKENLEKGSVSNKKNGRKRRLYLEKRLKEWMPCQDFVNPRNGVDYVVIADLAREALKKEGEIADEIVNFVAKREHRIITKEAAWHAVWIRKDNEFKHNDHSRDVTEIEEKLNRNRERTKMLEGTKMTAYDLAHKAAEFAEQTLAVFAKIAEVDNLGSSGD